MEKDIIFDPYLYLMNSQGRDYNYSNCDFYFSLFDNYYRYGIGFCEEDVSFGKYLILGKDEKYGFNKSGYSLLYLFLNEGVYKSDKDFNYNNFYILNLRHVDKGKGSNKISDYEKEKREKVRRQKSGKIRALLLYPPIYCVDEHFNKLFEAVDEKDDDVRQTFLIDYFLTNNGSNDINGRKDFKKYYDDYKKYYHHKDKISICIKVISI